MRTFVMAGGGTGGHILPALAVAQELRERGHQVQFIGVQSGLEARLVPAEKFLIRWIDIGGLNRVGLWPTMKTLAKLPLSVWRASRILKQSQPSAVFSTGGYVAGPVLLAAMLGGTPIVIMEPNAIPGFTHRKMAKFVTRALVSFPETARWFPAGRTRITGLPTRREFFLLTPKPRAEMITVLITGGSQGSQRLNSAVRESWPLWSSSPLHGKIRLVHQTGKRMYQEIERAFRATRLSGEVAEFLPDMARVLGEADIVVARSGMGTVSELAASGKPSMLVPFPAAADDHQLKNAQVFQQAGAAKLVLDHDMNGQRLVDEVTRLATVPGLLETMAQAARSFAHPAAAANAADALEEVAAEYEGKSKR